MNLSQRYVLLLLLMSLGMMGTSLYLVIEARQPKVAAPAAPRAVTERGALATSEASTIAHDADARSSATELLRLLFRSQANPTGERLRLHLG